MVDGGIMEIIRVGGKELQCRKRNVCNFRGEKKAWAEVEQTI